MSPVVVLWRRAGKLHERLMASCEGMFEQMPETFLPKKMLHGIEEVRANTALILDRLESDEERADTAPAPVGAGEPVHPAA